MSWHKLETNKAKASKSLRVEQEPGNKQHVCVISFKNEGLLRQIFLLNQSEPLDEDVGKVEHWKGVHPVMIGWITVSFSHHQDKPTAFFQDNQ